MSKFFNSSRQGQESTEWESKRNVSLPELDVLLTEMPESSGADVPMVQVPGGFQFNGSLKEFEFRAAEEKIRKGTGEYRRVQLAKNSKVLLPDDNLSDLRSDSYRRIRTRLIQQRSNMGFHVVAITSSIPGEGKTLTAINLALCCSQLADFKVFLIDADLRTRGCSNALGINSGPGLAEVLTSVATCSDAIAVTDQPNFYVMSAGDAKLPAPELFASSAWTEFATWAGRHFDLVIVDAPPVLPVPDFELIGAGCERVIIVARPFVSRNEDLERTLARIERQKFAGVVMNGSESGTRSYYYKQEYASRNSK